MFEIMIKATKGCIGMERGTVIQRILAVNPKSYAIFVHSPHPLNIITVTLIFESCEDWFYKVLTFMMW